MPVGDASDGARRRAAPPPAERDGLLSSTMATLREVRQELAQLAAWLGR